MGGHWVVDNIERMGIVMVAEPNPRARFSHGGFLR
jgi:hypothetical protein